MRLKSDHHTKKYEFSHELQLKAYHRTENHKFSNEQLYLQSSQILPFCGVDSGDSSCSGELWCLIRHCTQKAH